MKTLPDVSVAGILIHAFVVAIMAKVIANHVILLYHLKWGMIGVNIDLSLQFVTFLTTLYGGRVYMGITEIISAAFFCFSMVFVLLGGLFILLKLSTYAVKFIETKTKK